MSHIIDIDNDPNFFPYDPEEIINDKPQDEVPQVNLVSDDDSDDVFEIPPEVKREEKASQHDSPNDEELRAKRVFFGNLTYKTTWYAVKKFMRKAGDVVRVELFEDREGHSKGFGIAEFTTPAEAQNAIKKLNKTLLEGRYIFIREDDSKFDKFSKPPHVLRERAPEKQNDSLFYKTGNRNRSLSRSRSRSHDRKKRNDSQSHKNRSKNRSHSRSRSKSHDRKRKDKRSRSKSHSHHRKEHKHHSERDHKSPKREKSRSEDHDKHRGKDKNKNEDEDKHRKREKSHSREKKHHHHHHHHRNRSKDKENTKPNQGYQVIVKNLPWSVTWQQLKKAFKEFEPLKAEVASDEMGKSRGYGYLKFEKEKDATKAIDGMNGALFNGRNIIVRMYS